MPGVVRDVDVRPALAALTERLVERFAGDLPREVVEETVAACAARFHDARIVEFVPLLTERLSVGRLHDVVDGAVPPAVGSGARRAS